MCVVTIILVLILPIPLKIVERAHKSKNGFPIIFECFNEPRREIKMCAFNPHKEYALHEVRL